MPANNLPPTRPLVRLDFIDSIRGVAILMVILTHVAPVVPDLPAWLASVALFGRFGVQLFFIASAYTLCLSADRKFGRPGALRAYAIHRYLRIAPVYYLAIPLYALVGAVVLASRSGALAVPEQYTWMNVLSNLTFTHGLYPPANNTIVPGGWSIGTEMLF